VAQYLVQRHILHQTKNVILVLAYVL